MNIISFEEKTFEGIAAKFEYFVQRVDNLCRRHGEKKMTSGWITTMYAKNCVSVRGHCKHFVITERLHSARLGTRPTIVPKMLNALLELWRIDARRPNGEVEPFDRVK